MKELRPLVYICSPLRPVSANPVNHPAELEANLRLARDACTLACYRGYIPIAPHLYFPQFLDDNNPSQREIGLSIGIETIRYCDALWIVSKRISFGMSAEIKEAKRVGVKVLVFTAEGFQEYRGTGDVTEDCVGDTITPVKK